MAQEIRRWGKAGQRLTPAEAERLRVRAAKARHEAQRWKERHLTEGRRLWAAGRLVPWAITVCLDARGLDGPEVDIACGATEPEVDHWEAGILYPSWEQTVKLAALCEVPIARLAHQPLPGNMFICGPGACQPVERDPVLSFTQLALERALGGGAGE